MAAILAVFDLSKIAFQNGGHDRYIVFQVGPILALFDVQVLSIPPIKFRVKWPFFGSS